MNEINPIEKAYQALLSQNKAPIKLFSGNPNTNDIFFPQEILKKSYRHYFEKPIYDPHPKGLQTAREAIAKDYAKQGVAINPEHILLTSGTSESFWYLFTLLAEAGDNILAPVPSYPIFEHVANMARINLKPYKLREEKNWTIDFESLEEAYDTKTRAMLLVSPNNPTGAVSNPEEIEKLVHWCNQKNITLICDEVFSEFYFGEGQFPRPIALAKPNLCFTLNGISKRFALPAYKLSWIVVSGEDKNQVHHAVDKLETMTDTLLSCHTAIQHALPDIFKYGKTFTQSYVEEVQVRRKLALSLLDHCPNLSIVTPQGGFYLTARVKESDQISEDEWVIQLMKEKGVMVHPGYFFDYENGINFMISFLTKPEELKNGIEKIIEFVSN